MSRPGNALLALRYRLDCTLRRVADYPASVRAIYLTSDEFALLRAERYQGHDVRIGKCSRVYSTRGVTFNITAPRKSPRTL